MALFEREEDYRPDVATRALSVTVVENDFVEGVAIAAEVGRALRGVVQGVNIVAPLDRHDLALDLLDALS